MPNQGDLILLEYLGEVLISKIIEVSDNELTLGDIHCIVSLYESSIKGWIARLEDITIIENFGAVTLEDIRQNHPEYFI